MLMTHADSHPARATAGATAHDAVRAIETAPLDELLAIRQEQARLDGFRQRAESMKDQVDARVYDRVQRDYGGRYAVLDARARPLMAQAAREYFALRELRARTEATHDTARLAREELQFRHAVGELDEAALAAQLREPEQTIDRCGAELAALDALKARFIEAAGSEAALEQSQPIESSPSTIESSQTNIFMAPASDTIITTPSDDDAPSAQASAREPAAFAAPESSHTVIYTAAQLIATQLTATAGSPEATDPPPDAPRHHLGLTTSVGRSDENNVVVANPSVSRQHAMLEATPDGYIVRDLQSQNGTFVNGERVDTRPLRDGDEVIFGDARYIFRAFAAGAAPAAG